jgi:hypothetical protein
VPKNPNGTREIAYNIFEASGTDKDLLLYADGKTFSKTVTSLVTGDIVLFKTADGKLGLLNITATSGATFSDAVMSFDGLVQK